MVAKFCITIVVISLIKNSCQAIETCTEKTEKISNLHGVLLAPVQDLPITLCVAAAVKQNQPINLPTYKDYLKFQTTFGGPQVNERITRIYANTFSQLPEVKTLIIEGVNLQVIEPNAFKNLANLLYLNLNNNLLRSLPGRVFSDVPQLIELSLEHNGLEVIDGQQFKRLVNLKKLELSHNKLSDLPNGWADELANLEYLALGNNLINRLPAGVFDGLNKLHTLRLHGNKLGVIELDAFRGLSSLQSLTLENNVFISRINYQHELQNLPNLKGLSMSPTNFLCSQFESALSYANQKGIDVVNVPQERGCVKDTNLI